MNTKRANLALAAFLAAWTAIYLSLSRLSALATGLLGIDHGTHFGASVEFLLFEVPKVLLLLVLIVFGVGILRSYFSPEKTRRILSKFPEGVGNVLASLLGIATPFCSCSAVPLFIGFLTAGVPLGVTFSFLISAPMVNEVALALLFGLFGWKVAALYLVTGLTVAMVGGWTIGKLRMENHVEDWVMKMRSGAVVPESDTSWVERLGMGIQAVKDIVGKVWPWVVAGVGVGAFIHGYVPEGMLASFMGKDAWWTVPLAVLIGIPMYANAAGIIPVVSALLEKGAALGTALAFMMAVTALSAPEAILLRKVLKPRLLATFFGIVALGILLVGWVFNLLLA
ncbi:MAG: permease [Fibrobacterota bacterium]|nr:permease [Fibrobacterota bacterium]QQS03423.1 MAG: permease [Fibrobacterota bacterium]